MSRVEQNRIKQYQWWIKRERQITALLIFMLILLIFIQRMLLNSGFRGILNSIERLEGMSIVGAQTFIERGTIELTLNAADSGRLPVIYVNGLKAAEFDNNKAVLQVLENDIIEINGIGNTFEASVNVSKISEELKSPYLGYKVTVKDNIVFLGRVKLK